jgi:hypothetical protein
MEPDGPVRQIGLPTGPPGWELIPGLLTRFTNTGTLTSFKQYETKKLQRSLNFLIGKSKLFINPLIKTAVKRATF